MIQQAKWNVKSAKICNAIRYNMTKRMVMALVRRDVCTPIDTAADAERRFGPGYEFVAGAEPRVYQLH